MLGPCPMLMLLTASSITPPGPPHSGEDAGAAHARLAE